MTIRCPRCDSSALEPCDALLEAADEVVEATHECTKCHTRFRYTPGRTKEEANGELRT